MCIVLCGFLVVLLCYFVLCVMGYLHLVLCVCVVCVVVLCCIVVLICGCGALFVLLRGLCYVCNCIGASRVLLFFVDIAS